MKIRDPLYREVAHMIVDTNRRNARSISLDICRRLKTLNDADQKSNQPQSEVDDRHADKSTSGQPKTAEREKAVSETQPSGSQKTKGRKKTTQQGAGK